MFKKILVANRGEIAVRVMRTCKSLGIQTVAVYSEPDSEALHVKMADETYPLGGSRVADSYLNSEKILEIALQSKTEAIHPGYGLLSENGEFARRCEQEGIVFIGPPPDVISRMGSKIEARKAMESAGVPVVPGITHKVENSKEASKIAAQIGYPVMLKASSGGGGIGMQLVRNERELNTVFEGNQKRAKAFFGEDTMYLEKYIQNARHIEIQILSDHLFNTVFLWERECSIQRRHQKIIEEAPSTFLDDDTRNKLGRAAITAAKSIGYINAGTVEFLVDEQKNFYFLEMNTRLQVEHPITEEITHLDLVAEQIKIAAGHTLTYNQENIIREGHAIEVRIYAEDPNTFLPSPGKIAKINLPMGSNVRNEVGVSANSVVSHFYDPMIAKLIVKGTNRNEAIRDLKLALDQYEIEGIKTNIPLLQKIVEHPSFHSGHTTTDFIDRILNKKNF